MSQKKKQIREAFNTACLRRDGYRCAMCDLDKPPLMPDNWRGHLDVHHVNDRTLMPQGGYVEENGISLCQRCHLLAEAYHQTGVSHPGYSPEELYSKIGSSKEKAHPTGA